MGFEKRQQGFKYRNELLSLVMQDYEIHVPAACLNITPTSYGSPDYS